MDSKDSSAEDFERLLDRFKPLVQRALTQFAWPDSTAPKRLIEAMSYSLEAGGKRLRPILLLAACESVGADPQNALPVAAAFEMVHTYSLIHDDLPAMDNDDLRRGKPTCHKAFNEATAILAGDGMLTCAFEAIANGLPEPALAIEVIRELAKAAGIEGMVGGQQADLDAEGETRLDLKRLRSIHVRKTGALITAAAVCGGIVGRAEPPDLERLRAYGAAVGLAFQVVDDILDETASVEELGKSPGKDGAANKMTYPACMGLAKARQFADQLVAEACESLEGLQNSRALEVIAGYCVARGH